MNGDLLQQIRDLQHTDRSGAEALLLPFLQDALPYDITTVRLTPSAVSLNSFNGFITLSDGSELFFKTHTETDTVIDEYYNTELLAKAGYPIIQPVFQSTEPGQQLLVYKVIRDPSVFEVAWKIEQHGEEHLLPELTAAQGRADDDLMRLYRATWQHQSAEESAEAPIHQLFHHRLTKGRFARFYGNGSYILLPDGEHSMREVLGWQWQINGRDYSTSLAEITERATELLTPSQAGACIVGHGDAHNGNVFFRVNNDPPSLLYFDPAFAGTHSPLLDLVKPIFHNVFAMWMYYPQEKRDSTQISMQLGGNTVHVEVDYALHPVRKMFLQSKIDRVLIPTLRELKNHGELRSDWHEYLKAALYCCPMLTMNLADHEKFPPEISLLGLVMAVEMGATSSSGRSLIDEMLEAANEAL